MISYPYPWYVMSFLQVLGTHSTHGELEDRQGKAGRGRGGDRYDPKRRRKGAGEGRKEGRERKKRCANITPPWLECFPTVAASTHRATGERRRHYLAPAGWHFVSWCTGKGQKESGIFFVKSVSDFSFPRRQDTISNVCVIIIFFLFFI